MARIKYGAGLGGYEEMAYYTTPRDEMYLDALAKKHVEIGITTGGHIEFDGKDFKQKQGFLVDGAITKMTFYNDQDVAVYTASAIDYEVNKNFKFNIFDIIGDSTAGNDTVTGSSSDDLYMFAGFGRNTFAGLNGTDVILSYGGVDTATGKLGSDYFYFQPNESVKKQTLTITDFDANGGGDQQDYLYWYPELEYRAFERGDDLVILFEATKSKIIVENVSRPEFTEDDIQVPPEFPL